MQNVTIAIATALCGVGVSLGLLSGAAGYFASLLIVLAIYIAVVDLEYFIIPDLANLAMFALGLVLALTEARPDDGIAALSDALLRAAAAGGLFWLLRFGHARLSGGVGLGLGDVKLAAAGAPWLAWETLPVAIFVAATAGILAVLARAAFNRKIPARQTELPFGAFLGPTFWVCFIAERLWLSAN